MATPRELRPAQGGSATPPGVEQTPTPAAWITGALALASAGGPARQATIDGVEATHLVWVRATDGADLRQDGPVRTVNIRSTDQALDALAQWAARDGHDTSRVAPNLRNSVHGALNHRVLSHAYGDWDDKPVVVVAPLKDMVAANGAPTTLGTIDTWWAVRENGALRVPGATIVAPDPQGTLTATALSVRQGDVLYYATRFDDVRERQMLGSLSEHGRANVVDAANRSLAKDGTAPVSPDVLAQPRSTRPHGVNAAVDAKLTQIAQAWATHEAIRQHGPLRTGGEHGWVMPSAAERDTAAVAAAMGTKTGQHNGGDEWRSVKLMESGQAAQVRDVPGASEPTRRLADYLLSHPAYRAFAQAKAVDRELGALASGDLAPQQVSGAGAERLAVMAERARAGTPMPGIEATNSSTHRAGMVTPGSPGFLTLVQGAMAAHAGNEALMGRLNAAVFMPPPLPRAVPAMSAAPSRVPFVPVEAPIQRGASALAAVADALRKPDLAAPLPWEPAPVSMAARVRAFEAKAAQAKQQALKPHDPAPHLEPDALRQASGPRP